MITQSLAQLSSGPARYIVLEGDEGAGKTAQLERLSGTLTAAGIKCEIVREPGGDEFAEELRRILKHAKYHIPPIAEVLGFSAARASMLQNVVRPLLDHGTWVISDRSYLSTLVYQGQGHGLDSDEFRQVVEYGIQAAPPDLIIILDVSLEESSRRQSNRGLPQDRFDLGREFRHKINHGYKDFPSSANITHVNGEGSQNEIGSRISRAIIGMLEERG